MAFSFEGFAVGAMERGSELIREHKQEALDLVDSSLKVWTEMGLPAWRAKKKQTRELQDAAKVLQNRGFSDDQMYEIMLQNQHTRLLEHLQDMDAAGIKVNPADIVTFGSDYKESGVPIADRFGDIVGNVKSGDDLSTAIQKSTGKTVSGIQSAIMQKRLAAAELAMGVDPGQLRSYASGDFEYGESLGGTINILDPVKQAAAKEAIQGEDTYSASRLKQFQNLAGMAFGGQSVTNQLTGERRWQVDQVQDEKTAMLVAAQGQIKYNEFLKTMPASQAYDEALKWVDTTATQMAGQPRKTNNDGVITNDAVTGDTTSSAVNIAADLSGLEFGQIGDAAIGMLQGADATSQNEIVRQVTVALQNAARAAGHEDPMKAAQDELNSIMMAVR